MDDIDSATAPVKRLSDGIAGRDLSELSERLGGFCGRFEYSQKDLEFLDTISKLSEAMRADLAGLVPDEFVNHPEDRDSPVFIDIMNQSAVIVRSYINKLMEAHMETKEKDYLTDLDFGKALSYLKQGCRVARKGWNGKNMFLWLKPATTIKSEWCKDPELKKLVDENGGELVALGTICMYTHDSSGRRAVLTGWLASQSDMLLEDWYVVE